MNTPSFFISPNKTLAMVLLFLVTTSMQSTDVLVPDQNSAANPSTTEVAQVSTMPVVDNQTILELVKTNALFAYWNELVLTMKTDYKTRYLLTSFLARIMLHTESFASPLEPIETAFFMELNNNCQVFFENARKRLDRSAANLSPKAFERLLRAVFVQLFSEINKLVFNSKVKFTPRCSTNCTRFFASAKPLLNVGWGEWSLGVLSNWKAAATGCCITFSGAALAVIYCALKVEKKASKVIDNANKTVDSVNQLVTNVSESIAAVNEEFFGKGPQTGIGPKEPGLFDKVNAGVANTNQFGTMANELIAAGNKALFGKPAANGEPAIPGLTHRIEEAITVITGKPAAGGQPAIPGLTHIIEDAITAITGKPAANGEPAIPGLTHRVEVEAKRLEKDVREQVAYWIEEAKKAKILLGADYTRASTELRAFSFATALPTKVLAWTGAPTLAPQNIETVAARLQILQSTKARLAEIEATIANAPALKERITRDIGALRSERDHQEEPSLNLLGRIKELEKQLRESELVSSLATKTKSETEQALQKTQKDYADVFNPLKESLKNIIEKEVDEITSETKLEEKVVWKCFEERLAMYSEMRKPLNSALMEIALTFANASKLSAELGKANSFAGAQFRGASPEKMPLDAIQVKALGMHALTIPAGNDPSPADHRNAEIAREGLANAKHEIIKNEVVNQVFMSLIKYANEERARLEAQSTNVLC